MSLSMCFYYAKMHFKTEAEHQMEQYTWKLHKNACHFITGNAVILILL